jgi:membrane protein implicated in regulation of membrane protease activity
VDDPEVWRWVWLAVAVAGLVAEMASAGTFFALPFAIGAGVACVLAFVDAPLALQWLAFVGVSFAGVAALRPLARRLDIHTSSDGIGAKRWIGETAKVLDDIPAGINECGMVRVGREEWRAESRDGTPVPVGTLVRVIDVTGTRLVVWPLEQRKEIESP